MSIRRPSTPVTPGGPPATSAGRGLAIASIATAVAVVLSACAAPAEPELDSEITIAVGGIAVGSWNPADGGPSLDGNFAADGVLTSLFHWSPDGEAIPSLATDYEMAEDRSSLDITLRDDVEFADGSPLDADTVVTYFDYLLSDASTYVHKGTALEVGAEFSVVDESTVRLSFSGPVFHPDYHVWDVIRLLTLAPVLSPAAVADPAAAVEDPMGIGPYLIEEEVPEVSLTLVRNPAYWDPEAYPFDRIELLVIADGVAMLNALKSGQVDATSLPVEQVAEAEASGFRISHGSPVYYALLIQDPEHSSAEPLRDVRVRQAMMLAFDREAIAETIDRGYGRASSQGFIEGQAEYIEGGDERYGYDPEAARELLAEAGYPDGFDLSIPLADGTDNGLAPIIQQSLGDIGIRVTYETIPVSEYIYALTGTRPINIYPYANANTLRLLDEEFDGLGRFFVPTTEVEALLEDIRFGDPDTSAEASQELGELMLEEAWYIPISRPASFWASVPEIAVAADEVFGPGFWLHDIQRAED